jgi:hypothetical protein
MTIPASKAIPSHRGKAKQNKDLLGFSDTKEPASPPDTTEKHSFANRLGDQHVLVVEEK